jgi:hypothetical protein
MFLMCGAAHFAHPFPLLPALIVLAILGCTFRRREHRGRDAEAFAGDASGGAPWSGARGFRGSGSGNSAFDEWRAAELARLEEERRKLDEARREFEEFAESVRKARDREEFDRFMNARGRPQS